METFVQLPEGYSPNGIDIDSAGKNIFVALYSKPNALGKINIATKALINIALPAHESVGADGLYFYNNALIAVQPFGKDRAITQYTLDKSLTKVESIKVLLPDAGFLIQPTTGVIKDKELYFIANSQLQKFARLWSEKNGAVNPDELAPVKIAKIQL